MPPSGPAPVPVSSVETAGAVAVTPHHLATSAALGVLAAGGNAVDAAIAANAVQGAVEPATCGMGGDLFALVHLPGMGIPAALNASGRGGAGLDAAAVRAEGHTTMPYRSPWTVTAPGCVDGWQALAGRFGTRPLAELLAPAARLSEEGFPASAELAAALERLEPLLAGQPSAPALFPQGRPPRPGERLRNPALAEVLRAVGSSGRDAFYRGPVAGAIAAATGGVLTAADLARSHADWVAPIGVEVFGRHIWTVPPNSQGYLVAAAAWLLEQLGPPGDPGEAAFHHAVIECYRAVAWERDHLVADPERAPLAAHRLLDPDRLRPRLAALDPHRVAAWPQARTAPGGTAYLCVVDAAGMGVSLIQSNFGGIGSGLAAGTTGVWLHNRGAGFSLTPGHPNEAAPGRRPLHTLSPTLWTEQGRLALLLGTRGGHQQPQYLLQMAALLYLAGLDPAAAQAQPRWHMEEGGDGARSALVAEARMPEEVVSGLVRLGHSVSAGPALASGWGPVSVVAAAADGTRRGAADPRVPTARAAAQ